MKKYSMVLIVILIAVVLCVGCGNKTPDEKTEKIQETTTAVINDTYTVDDIPEDKDARLLTYESEEYRDIKLIIDEYVDVPNRVGYTFNGYLDEENDIYYIDADGKILRKVPGGGKVILSPKYSADEYEIVIYKDDKEMDNRIKCKYDASFKKNLPFGTIFDGDRKVDGQESCVVIGFAANNNILIENDDKDITPKMLGDAVNHETKSIHLDVVTSDITYCEQRTLNFTINDEGYLKQYLDGKTYDVFSLKEKMDLSALKNLRYKKVKFHVLMAIQDVKGEPSIKFLSKEATKKSHLKDYLLYETGNIEEKEINENDNYIIDFEIPISKLKENIYIYYNANGILKSSWNCSTLTVEIEITK